MKSIRDHLAIQLRKIGMPESKIFDVFFAAGTEFMKERDAARNDPNNDVMHAAKAGLMSAVRRVKKDSEYKRSTAVAVKS